MNSFNNRNNVFLISAIMAFIATASFIVVPITLTFIIAYFFTMLAIVMFCAGNHFMLSNAKSYPWLAIFPTVIWQYLVAQLSLSIPFVIRDMFFTGIFPLGLFVFLHLLLLSLFVVRLVLIKSGKEMIETKDAEIKQKTSVMRLMQADVESILREHPEHEKPLRRVIEALKYSDPMSHPSVGFYEQQIHHSISSMTGLNGNEPAKISEICETLIKQIASRNNRVKMLK